MVAASGTGYAGHVSPAGSHRRVLVGGGPLETPGSPARGGMRPWGGGERWGGRGLGGESGVRLPQAPSPPPCRALRTLSSAGLGLTVTRDLSADIPGHESGKYLLA